VRSGWTTPRSKRCTPPEPSDHTAGKQVRGWALGCCRRQRRHRLPALRSTRSPHSSTSRQRHRRYEPTWRGQPSLQRPQQPSTRSSPQISTSIASDTRAATTPTSKRRRERTVLAHAPGAPVQHRGVEAVTTSPLRRVTVDPSGHALTTGQGRAGETPPAPQPAPRIHKITSRRMFNWARRVLPISCLTLPERQRALPPGDVSSRLQTACTSPAARGPTTSTIRPLPRWA
jgi:hypothetical protein